MVSDLTQVSGGRSKCKGGFCRPGPLAVWAETWQGDEHPPREVNPCVWDGNPHPQGQGALKWGPGVRLQRDRFLKGGLGFAAGVENAPGEAGYPC